ncbi:FtsX-like permease family protein [Exiguobacterium sp. Helios]|uniref:ABC transporter permease n=1 Tax=Exiguobacterium sp. Helios TaxID=2735868 RepID=UPI00165D605D|nr:ABC transporter permease [Exiguobacterium sp. Helios]QNR21116.1 FtsX-like permease family protein [Exiguobacterium sp. Helios]
MKQEKRHLFRLALKLYRKSPMILLTSIGSVMISILLVLSMVLFVSQSQASVQADIERLYGKMDLSVGYQDKRTEVIDQSFLDRLTQDKQTRQLSPVLITNLTVTGQTTADVYTIGIKNDSLAKSRYHIKRSIDRGDLILNAGLADAFEVKVGQELTVSGSKYEVIEILPDAAASGAAPDTLVMNYDDLTQLNAGVSQKKRATYVLVQLKPDADVVDYADRLTQKVPGLRVDLAETAASDVNGVSAMQVYVAIIAGLILIVSAFILMTNFDVFLRKHRYQFAIMRTLGATTRQLFQIFMIQSSLIVCAGALMAFLLSGLFYRTLQEQWRELFALKGTVIAFNWQLAGLVTVGSSLLILLLLSGSAYRNRRILPIHVMRQNHAGPKVSRLRERMAKTFAALTVGALLYATILAQTENHRAGGYLGSTISFLVLMYSATPLLLQQLLVRIEPLLQKVAGPTTFVAVRSVLPQLRKNALLMLIVQILLVVVVLGSTFLETIKQHELTYLKEQYPTELVLKSRLIEGTKADPLELTQTIEKELPKVKSTFVSPASGLEILKSDHTITLDYALTDLEKLDAIGKPVRSLKNDQFIVSKAFAQANALEVGDRLEVGRFIDGETGTVSIGQFEVGQIDPDLPTDAWFDWRSSIRTSEDRIGALYIDATDTEQIQGMLQELTTRYPTLQLNRYETSVNLANQQLQERWIVFIVALAVMSVSVWFGLANSLLNYLATKRREYALLRTLVLTRSSLRRLILIQMLIFIGSGIGFGLVTGIGTTFLISRVDRGNIALDLTSISMTVTGLVVLVFGLIWFTTRQKQENLVEELNQ